MILNPARSGLDLHAAHVALEQSAVELVKRRRQLLVRESQEALTADDLHNVDEFSLKCAYKQHQKQLRARDVKEHRRWVILGAP